MGMSYEKGLHVKKHWATALEWYRRAAVQGLEEGYALYEELDEMMEGEAGAWDRLETKVVGILARSCKQKGVEPANALDAIEWRLGPAKEGDAYARWRLHELYLLKEKGNKNRDVAVKWLTMACDGHPDETVREYFELMHPRIGEVVAEHAVDVWRRWDSPLMAGPESMRGR